MINVEGLSFTELSPDFVASAQLDPKDFAAIAAAGYRSIINNRPDFEGGASQPSAQQMAEAAALHGLEFVSLPVVMNEISAADVATFKRHLNSLPKPIVGYCAVGGRVKKLYGLSQASQIKTASIAQKLIGMTILIAVVASVVLATLLDRVSATSLEATYRKNLLAVSQRKVSRLEEYASELTKSIYAAGRSTEMANLVAGLDQRSNWTDPDVQEMAKIDTELMTLLQRLSALYGFVDATIFSPDGRVLFSLNHRLEAMTPGSNILTGPLKDTEVGHLFERTSTLLQSGISEIAQYEGIDEPAVFLAGPVQRGQEAVGILMMQIDNKALHKILLDYSGLYATGEVVASQRDGDVAQVIAPTRFAPWIAFHPDGRIPLNLESNMPIRLSIAGERWFGLTQDLRGKDVISISNYSPSFRWGIVVKQDVEEALALLSKQRSISLYLLVFLLLPISLAAFLMARTISIPIRHAAHAAQQLVSGDLTVEVKPTGKGDEPGILILSLHYLVGYLRSLIGTFKNVNAKIGSAADRVAVITRSQEESVNTVSASTSEIAAAAQQIASTAEELLAAMQVVAEKVQDTAVRADQGREKISGMDVVINQLAVGSETIGDRLQVIAQRAEKINGVVTTITKVADQTNLLSLNAAIEAEVAGEAGRGFAVVAQEIRRLADQTAVGTLHIEKMVQEMQAAVTEGVREMESFGEMVQGGVAASASTGEQLGLIIEQVKDLQPRFELVKEGMLSQSLGAQEIAGSMHQLTDVASETSGSIDELVRATEEMRSAVALLNQSISRFKIGDEA